MRRAIVLVAAAACGRSTQDDRACERTIEAAYERVAHEQHAAGVPGAGSALAAATKLTTISSCEADRWPDEVLRCIQTARLEVDVTSCFGRLTHDQWESLHKKIDTLRARLAEPPPVAGPDAHPIDPYEHPPDAAPPAPIDAPDASVATPDVPVRIPPLDAPTAPDAPRRDCRRTVIDARDPACMKQYCDAHPAELRCQIE